MKWFSLLLKTFILIILTGCSLQQDPVLVKFDGPLAQQKWAIKDLNPDLPSDWSSFGFLSFEINSSTTQLFDLMLYDAAGIRRLVIQPFQGARVRASIPLVHFQTRNTRGMDMAAIGKTARPGYWIGFTGSVGSIKQVDSLGMAMRLPIGSPAIEFNN